MMRGFSLDSLFRPQHGVIFPPQHGVSTRRRSSMLSCDCGCVPSMMSLHEAARHRAERRRKEAAYRAQLAAHAELEESRATPLPAASTDVPAADAHEAMLCDEVDEEDTVPPVAPPQSTPIEQGRQGPA